jgi:hypothetical protein
MVNELLQGLNRIVKNLSAVNYCEVFLSCSMSAGGV